jgi:hypothetical protein
MATEDIKRTRIEMLVTAIVGVVLVWYAWNNAGINNVIASAAFGLVGGLVLKKHFAIFYSATFAGMCSAAVIPHWYWAVLVGVILWALWILLEKMFAGVGGKFGMIAMVAGQIAAIVVLLVGDIDKHPIYNSAAEYTDIWQIWLLGPIVAAVSAYMVVWLLKNKSETVKNTTVGSAIVGLIGGFLLLALTEELLLKTTENIIEVKTIAAALAAACFTGSFVGMASAARMETKGVMPDYCAYLITGAISSLILLLLTPYLGTGGKYGFSAFCAVLIWNQIIAKYILPPIAVKRGAAKVEKKEE